MELKKLLRAIGKKQLKLIGMNKDEIRKCEMDTIEKVGKEVLEQAGYIKTEEAAEISAIVHLAYAQQVTDWVVEDFKATHNLNLENEKNWAIESFYKVRLALMTAGDGDKIIIKTADDGSE